MLYEIVTNATTHGFGGADVAIFIGRAAVGTFFAISGFHKLFHAGRHATLVETLKACGVPFIGFNQWFVPGVEFLAGMALTVGLFTPLAALGLLVICAVATLTDGRRKVAQWRPHINGADCLACYLYLVEVIYILVLLVFVFGGCGLWGVDNIVALYI